MTFFSRLVKFLLEARPAPPRPRFKPDILKLRRAQARELEAAIIRKLGANLIHVRDGREGLVFYGIGEDHAIAEWKYDTNKFEIFGYGHEGGLRPDNSHDRDYVAYLFKEWLEGGSPQTGTHTHVEYEDFPDPGTGGYY